jgi:integrase
MSIKFYSLRDSGIIQMLEQGISAEYVRQQADHSSLDMTTIYSKHARPEGIEQIKHKIKGF